MKYHSQMTTNHNKRSTNDSAKYIGQLEHTLLRLVGVALMQMVA